jgi:glycosyltransferase involved in cell wall biosynthesis
MDRQINVVALEEFGGLQALYCCLLMELLARGVDVATFNRSRRSPAPQVLDRIGFRDHVASSTVFSRLDGVPGMSGARRLLGQANLVRHVRREIVRSKARRIVLWNALPYAAYTPPGTSMILYDHGLSSIQKPTRAKRDSLNDVERIICVSHANKHLLRERWQYRGQIDVLPNPLRPDISITAPAEPKRLREMPVIGCAARLVPVKGIASLVHAVALLRDRGVAVRLRIAGDGPELDILTEAVRLLDMGSLVEFHGHVENMGAFYESVDVFVAPSLREPFGLSVLEAMAHSLPVILSNIDGHPEAITYTDAAIFVEPTLSLQDYRDLGASSGNTPDSVYSPAENSVVKTGALCPMVLADAIGRGLENYDALSDAAFRASKRIPEEYSFAAYVDRYLGLVT